MASEFDTRQLLEGVVEGNPWKAFGLACTLTLAELRRECRIKQSEFHQDKGNPILISQLANDCASVLCGRQHRLTSCLQIAANKFLNDLMQQGIDDFRRHMRERAELERKAHFDRVVSRSNVEREQ